MSLIIHPRPSPLAAAMYTLRDLNVDVIVIHGPSGCCFRPARLLEKEGIKVVTTALTDEDFVFGAEAKLARVLKRVDELFRPKLIGVLGSCASMITGEDLRKAAREADLDEKTLCCDVHSGSGDNTIGAVIALKEALKKKLISQKEFERQKMMLDMATELEKKRGTARCEYLNTMLGDSPKNVALKIFRKMNEGSDVACVLNMKKETAFLYADIMLAMNELAKKIGITFRKIANLNPDIGLPRVRSYAVKILEEFNNSGIEVDNITGGLDEYPLAGVRAKEILTKNPPELVVIAGIPHAVEVEQQMETVAVTVGTRSVSNLKSLGYSYVVAERDAHSVSLGINKRIQKSILGQALRKVAETV